MGMASLTYNECRAL